MSKQGYSIEFQLQSRLTKLLLLLAILLLVPLHLTVRSFVDAIIEQRLGHDAETIISALSVDQNNQWQLQLIAQFGMTHRSMSCAVAS